MRLIEQYPRFVARLSEYLNDHCAGILNDADDRVSNAALIGWLESADDNNEIEIGSRYARDGRAVIIRGPDCD